jgi:hypothetical protein
MTNRQQPHSACERFGGISATTSRPLFRCSAFAVPQRCTAAARRWHWQLLHASGSMHVSAACVWQCEHSRGAAELSWAWRTVVRERTLSSGAGCFMEPLSSVDMKNLSTRLASSLRGCACWSVSVIACLSTCVHACGPSASSPARLHAARRMGRCGFTRYSVPHGAATAACACAARLEHACAGRTLMSVWISLTGMSDPGAPAEAGAAPLALALQSASRREPGITPCLPSCMRWMLVCASLCRSALSTLSKHVRIAGMCAACFTQRPALGARALACWCHTGPGVAPSGVGAQRRCTAQSTARWLH